MRFVSWSSRPYMKIKREVFMDRENIYGNVCLLWFFKDAFFLKKTEVVRFYVNIKKKHFIFLLCFYRVEVFLC